MKLLNCRATVMIVKSKSGRCIVSINQQSFRDWSYGLTCIFHTSLLFFCCDFSFLIMTIEQQIQQKIDGKTKPFGKEVSIAEYLNTAIS